MSYMDKDYDAFNDLEMIIEEVYIGRPVETTVQMLYHKGSFVKYDKADEKLKGCVPVERRRFDLDELKEDFIQ